MEFSIIIVIYNFKIVIIITISINQIKTAACFDFSSKDKYTKQNYYFYSWLNPYQLYFLGLIIGRKKREY